LAAIRKLCGEEYDPEQTAADWFTVSLVNLTVEQGAKMIAQLNAVRKQAKGGTV
jgi:hypothetical protein